MANINQQSQSSFHTSPQRPPQDPGRETPETSFLESVAKEKEEWPELLPQSWRLPEDAWGRWRERRNDFTAEEKKKAWDETAKIVKDYSDELVKRWKEEIDTLLVYAGLFSAVLTALIVESYKLLSPPPPDPVLAALQQISVQLSSFSINPPFVNSTQPITSQVLPPAPLTPRWAVWLNTLWFSSLVFSLSAASVGIMVKQWLNEYSTGLFGDSRHFARLRQHRLQNLERWHVVEIVAILPILLQIALALFFGGLLVLLWILNSDVATVASALVGLLFACTIGSSLIPVFRADCCYLSPSVYLFVIAVHSAKTGVFHCGLFMWNVLCRISRRLSKCLHDSSAASIGCNSLQKDRSWTFTWRGRELKQISKSSDCLDTAMVTTAYASTMDHSYLNKYATICVSDFLQPSQVGDCYRGLTSEMDRHQLDKADIPLTIQSDLWLAIKYSTEDRLNLNRDGLPDMDRFWAASYRWRNIPTVASSHWRNHLWANVLIDGNTSVAYGKVVRLFDDEDYGHCSNAVRRRAVRVVEQELRQHGQEAIPEALIRCSQAIRMLLRWVGASSRAKDAQPEDIEMAKAIRALTRHGLLCHFKCYTTEAGKMLSLYRNNTEILISRLHTLCEEQASDFMTPELVDVLLRVYEVHQDECHRRWSLEKSKPWILKLKCEHEESKKNDCDGTSCGEVPLRVSVAAVQDKCDTAAAPPVSVVE